MSKGIAALIVSAADPDLKAEASIVLHGVILDCIRLTTPPPPPAPGRLPHGFADLDADKLGGGSTGAAADEPASKDPKGDFGFSPLEAVVEHLRGRRVTSPCEITDAIVDGLSDVRKDVQGVALGLIE